MENQGAKLVADSLLGIDFKTVFLGEKAYTVHPPRTNIIARGISHWAEFDFKYELDGIIVISQEPKNLPCLFKGLAAFVVGNKKYWRIKSYLLYRYWMKNGVLNSELREAVKTVFDLSGGQDFFDCASSLKNVVELAGKAKS